MRYGWRLLEDGSTYNARQVFEDLVLVAPGSAVIDSVHYGLAETYYLEKNYYQARVEYQTVVSSFPRSPLVDDAAFKAALCYWNQSPSYKLDQTETLQAIDAFRGFFLDYPTSDYADQAERYLAKARDKLAHKKLYEGRTYYRLGTPRDMDAAEIYLTEVFQHYPESTFVPEALMVLGKVYLNKDDPDRARQVFAALVAQFPDSEPSAEARKKLKELGAPPPSESPPSLK